MKDGKDLARTAMPQAAGEAGGILDTILMRLATFMEKNDALVRKVKGAMIYPGVIMGVAGTAITVLLSLELAATLLLLGAQVISEYERLATEAIDAPPEAFA